VERDGEPDHHRPPGSEARGPRHEAQYGMRAP
jgi:hypothetical protein